MESSYGVELSREKLLEALENKDAATLLIFLLDLNKVARATLNQYRATVGKLMSEIDTPLHKLTRLEGQRYIASLENVYKPSTIKSRLTILRALYGVLSTYKIETENPFFGIKAKADSRPAREQGKHYTQNELQLMLEHADDTERVLLLLCGHAGLRVSEACAARWLDISDEGRLRVVGKGGKHGEVSLSKSLREALDVLPREGQRILPFTNRSTAYDHVRKICKRAETEFKGCHALRHTAGDIIAEMTNGNTMLVARHLRHENPATADRYVNKAARELDRLMNRL